ncbi:MAG: YnbE family lipoprotein [Alphaproteobacteria bacterium]
MPPDEPIVINLNIKIEQEIRIKIDNALDDLLDEEEGLF